MKRLFTRAPLELFMIAVAIFWLTPTVGLLLQSLRSGADIAQSGWWTVFSNPSQLSFASYVRLLQEPGMAQSVWNTVLITVPTTLLVVLLGALAAYPLAWIPFK